MTGHVPHGPIVHMTKKKVIAVRTDSSAMLTAPDYSFANHSWLCFIHKDISIHFLVFLFDWSTNVWPGSIHWTSLDPFTHVSLPVARLLKNAGGAATMRLCRMAYGTNTALSLCFTGTVDVGQLHYNGKLPPLKLRDPQLTLPA